MSDHGTPPSPRLDRLSALLDGLAPQVTIVHAGPLAATRRFAAETTPGLHLHLVLAGTLALDGLEHAAPAALLLQAGREHALTPAGPQARLLSARIRLSGPTGPLLQDAFVRPMALDLAADDELAPLLALVRGEVEQPRCGHRSLLAHAVDIVLIALLRHIIARPGNGAGMLAALADIRIARSVVAMNERPGQPWSLETLAARAGMSRTAFAQAFRERMGMTPGRYLGGLRLALAARAVGAGEGLKRAAGVAGYASPAALSRALSRWRREREAPR